MLNQGVDDDCRVIRVVRDQVYHSGRKPGINERFGDRTVPMDDALVHCALDLGGRPYNRGPLPSVRYEHWMRSFADNARATLHLRVLRGQDRHHIVEAAFKALHFHSNRR